MDNLIEDLDFLDQKTEKTSGFRGKLYIESYGCQMNFSDSEIVASVLGKEGFSVTGD
ncbi:MAG: tRNA (N6-isopentenyl adenosine(37)-C2)-methylthiotransferase MiaB, partial [Bacteroidota bacterium]